jgi:hypothetical protein
MDWSVWDRGADWRGIDSMFSEEVEMVPNPQVHGSRIVGHEDYATREGWNYLGTQS